MTVPLKRTIRLAVERWTVNIWRRRKSQMQKRY